MNTEYPDASWRSPRLLDSQTSGLVVIDIQDRLVEQISERRRLIWNTSRLLRAAKLLEVPVMCSEQYPAKLGDTVEPLLEYLPERHEKRDFSAAVLTAQFQAWAAAERSQMVLVGIETHVCLLQSALDLTSAGFDVFVVVDAVAARNREDHGVAIDRLRDEGVSLTTTESVMFEWCRTSLHPNFKAVSQLVQESPGEIGPGIGFAGIGFATERRPRGGG